MKIKNAALIASMLLASLSAAKAATTLTAWTFDNLAIATNGSPQPSTGFGTAGALGISDSYVQGIVGSSYGNTNCWDSGVNGWSTNAPIGTQGAQFAVNTLGYYQIQVSFDVYATPDAEANLQVQYTTDGHIWNNAAITSVGTLGVIANNSANNSTVSGSYVILTNNGTTGWNNQITANLTGISGVDNNANFAVRVVNASTGTNCVTTTGSPFNNTSGSWTFDNVVVQGVSFDTVADWTFETEPNNGTIILNPVPEISVGNYTFAQALGFNNNYSYAGSSTPGSTNGPDVVNTGGSSSGAAGPNAWRVRGNPGNNGWNTAAPIGTQGAEFDVSTLNFSNILVTFDMYSTSQGEAKMCMLYTTDGWATTNVAQNLFYPANPTFIQTNPASGSLNSPNTVAGTYFYQNTGQNFYNYLTVDFTGIPGVANNPLFGFKIVNAATGPDCVAYNGGSYNNSSGNWRYDNVAVSGQFNGLTPPVVTNAPNATVDSPFTNTFTDNPAWRSAITTIYVNGSVLTNTAYNVSNPGKIVFTPSKSPVLQLSGFDYIVINAAGYSSVKVAQPVGAGVTKKLTVIFQPAAPSASGGTLTVNPAVGVTDQYGNGTTNPYPNLSITASVSNSVAWTLGGATNQTSANGFVYFTNLSATVAGSSAVSSAVIKLTVSGYTNSANQTTVTNIYLSSFKIGVPPVPFTPGNLAILQIDAVSNNTTFSIIEVKPSAVGQTAPVNIVPISATGTNALRQSSAGSTGRLALSDDLTMLCFAAFADGNSATPDETLNLNRAVGTLNYTNLFTEPASYTSLSLGGSQARAAVTVDDVNWIIDDKGGLYYGNGYIPNPNINALNNVVVKSFGGTAYVETQKTANGSPIPVVYALAPGNPPVPVPDNLGTDPLATDFYIVSSNGTDNSIMYIIDQVSSSLGIINKYSWVPDVSQISGYAWDADGTFTNGTGGDTLFATTNGNGGVYLFFTTGGGGTGGNSIVRLTDASGWNQPINIISSNVIYTASKTTSIKGLTFVPQQTAYATELIPPPILIAQNYASTNNYSSFAVTNTSDDPLWRANITGITVNGSALPTAAYDTTQPDQIVFNPAQSSLLGQGTKTIVISATGYSTNSITQNIIGAPAKLAFTTALKGPAADGGSLAIQPMVVFEDSSNNIINFGAATITATALQGTWALGGATSLAAVNGAVAFTNLTAFSANIDTGGTNAVNAATISFTSSGVTAVTSTSFSIPLPIHSNLGGVALSGGNFTFIFTNATGLSFSVLATNNIAAPTANWPFIGTATESPAGSGKYQFTNSATTNMLFYILRQP